MTHPKRLAAQRAVAGEGPSVSAATGRKRIALRQIARKGFKSQRAVVGTLSRALAEAGGKLAMLKRENERLRTRRVEIPVSEEEIKHMMKKARGDVARALADDMIAQGYGGSPIALAKAAEIMFERGSSMTTLYIEEGALDAYVEHVVGNDTVKVEFSLSKALSAVRTSRRITGEQPLKVLPKGNRFIVKFSSEDEYVPGMAGGHHACQREYTRHRVF